MEFANQTAVVTGGASGIGLALCRALAAEGMNVVVADLDAGKAQKVADDLGAAAFGCDAGSQESVSELIDYAETRIGPVALYVSNAGVAKFETAPDTAVSAPEEAWQLSWQVNVMAHIYAARILIPRMELRGSGHFLITASAAGLLSQIGGAPYATTKHAAVAYAEALAIAHGDKGIGVSVLCPQGVDTPMLRSLPQGPQASDGVLPADEVAARAVEGLRAGNFMILSHSETARYLQRKAQDYDGWIRGMSKLKRSFQQ